MPNDLIPCRDVFSRDPALYLDLTQPVARGTGQVLDTDETGALVAVPYAGDRFTCTLFARTEARARDLCRQIPPHPQLVVCHETVSCPVLLERFGYASLRPSWQAGRFSGVPLPLPDTPFSLRPLTTDALPAVSASYALTDPDYLEEALRRGDMTGAFLDGTLCGFIGRHRDGSIGMLEVLPAFRGQGAARALLTYMTNECILRGEIPYTQTFVGNEVSLSLQARLGFTCSSGHLYWPAV